MFESTTEAFSAQHGPVVQSACCSVRGTQEDVALSLVIPLRVKMIDEFAEVSRLIRDQEVGGSNPLAPTKSFNNLQAAATKTTHPIELFGESKVRILRSHR